MTDGRDFWYDLFAREVIAKVEGTGDIDSYIGDDECRERKTCVGIRCAHGEIVFSSSAIWERENRFLSFVQVLDGIFQEYAVLTDFSACFEHDWSQTFQLTDAQGRITTYTAAIGGYFTAIEEHLMRAFVTANERIVCRLLCDSRGGTNSSPAENSLVIEIDSLETRITIEGEGYKPSGFLYRKVSRSPTGISVGAKTVWLGSISLPLSTIADLLVGKPLFLSLPRHGEGLREGDVPESVPFSVDDSGRIRLLFLAKKTQIAGNFRQFSPK